MQAPETRLARLLRGGTEGNARLTGMTGLVLLVLLAIEGVTILAIRPLLSSFSKSSFHPRSRAHASTPARVDLPWRA